MCDLQQSKLLVQAILEQDSMVVKTLLEEGLDPNLEIQVHSWTALHLAVEHDCLEIAQMLLNYGASIDAPDGSGCTSLFFAVDLEIDSASQLGIVAMPNISRMLLELGANPNQPNRQGETPLSLATMCNYTAFLKIAISEKK
ncbi:MAG: hypothetical protein GQ535_01915 [Rhodobacteraceae bacterium]|nr:hypothetical protein [Paracoccaceae bacterium]